ncbi:MAG: hypothetical protein L3J65_08425 [Robiginitomaculum sp.]|nr:hypothetical protein [Robiginitomaculum sp.]
MDGFDGLGIDAVLLDSSAIDAWDVLSFNNTAGFNAVMSLFNNLGSGNLSFDDFTNDPFWGTNNSFDGFNDFLNDFFGWDGDDEPPEPDPDEEEPIDEVIVTGTIVPQWQPNFFFDFGAYFDNALAGLFDIAPPDLDLPAAEISINCGTINIGGIDVEVNITSNGSNESNASNIQLATALDALSQAFAQNAGGGISLPGFGNQSYGDLFGSISGDPINLIVDNTLSDFINNTDSPITVTTAAGHQIVIQPNEIIRGYRDFISGGGANIYIDVESGIEFAGEWWVVRNSSIIGKYLPKWCDLMLKQYRNW